MRIGVRRLVVWRLVYTLGQSLSPFRVAYHLEPDITTATDFGIEVSTYVESESLFSPRLPIPAFPIRLSDLDTSEQPGVCLPSWARLLFLLFLYLLVS